MDESIRGILESLLRNNRGNSLHSVSRGIVRIVNYLDDLVTIDLETKCAYFHGNFSRTACEIPHLKNLIDYFEREDYETNLIISSRPNPSRA